MQAVVLAVLVALLQRSDACFARTQSIRIQGQLLCHGQAAQGIRVRLYDSDFPDVDDLIDYGVVDYNGNFYLSGYSREFSTIDPMLSIFHDCDDEHIPCLKRVDIKIPQTAVNDQQYPEYTYNVGVINLNGNFDGQTRDCID